MDAPKQGIPLTAEEAQMASQKRQAYQVAVRKRIEEIGIKEKSLYYIAERSLTAALPSNWVEAATQDGYIYYFNEKTEESVWHHPQLEQFKEQYARALMQQKTENAVKATAPAESYDTKTAVSAYSRDATLVAGKGANVGQTDENSENGGRPRTSQAHHTAASEQPTTETMIPEENPTKISPMNEVQRSATVDVTKTVAAVDENPDPPQTARGRSPGKSAHGRSPKGMSSRSLQRSGDSRDSRDSRTRSASRDSQESDYSGSYYSSSRSQSRSRSRSPSVTDIESSRDTQSTQNTNTLSVASPPKTARPSDVENRFEDEKLSHDQHELNIEGARKPNAHLTGLPIVAVSTKNEQWKQNSPPMTARGDGGDIGFPPMAAKIADAIVASHSQLTIDNGQTSSPPQADQQPRQGSYPIGGGLPRVNSGIPGLVSPKSSPKAAPRQISATIPEDAVLGAGAGAELEGLQVSDYWHQKYELASRDMKRMGMQMELMEVKLGEAVNSESRMMSEKHELVQNSRQCSQQLRSAVRDAQAFLATKGISVSTSEISSSTDPNSLVAASNEATFQLNSMCDEKMSSRDDRGFSRSWEGVSIRLTEEMNACFPSSSLVDIDSAGKDQMLNDLQQRLEALTQVITTFGEYLPHDRRSYIQPFLKHIRQHAPGSTMVPLEALTQTLSELGVEERSTAMRIPEGLHPLSKNSSAESKVLGRLALEPPSSVAALRSELDILRTERDSFSERFQEEQRQLHLITAKFDASELKADEARVREEAMMNRFMTLSKSLDGLRDAQLTPSTNGMVSTGEVTSLVERLANANSEASSANHRAFKVEKQLEGILKENKNMRETQIPALKLKCDRKKVKNKEMIMKMIELESISRSYYSTLQTSLASNAKLESEVAELHERVQRIRKERGQDFANYSNAPQASSSLEQSYLREQIETTEKELRKEREKSDVALRRLDEEQRKVNTLNNMTASMEMQVQLKNEEIQTQGREMRELYDRLEETEEALGDVRISENALKHLCLDLNNQIVAMYGDIRVFCRMRSFIGDEDRFDMNFDHYCQFVNDKKIKLDGDSEFVYDRVFSPVSDQMMIYNECLPFIRSVTHGNRATVFSYGQNGSGKTHGIYGNFDDASGHGITLRSLKTFYDIAKRDEKEYQTVISFSMIEMYNDAVTDLLPNGPSSKIIEGSQPELEIRHGGEVIGLTSWVASTIDDAYATLKIGQKNRKSISMSADHVTRSHMIVKIAMKRIHIRDESVLYGELMTIDLANSQRVQTSRASGQRLRDSQSINKSLKCLSDVINALKSEAAYVPYKNSKLTMLLEPALCNGGRCLVLANVCPSPDCRKETMNTLGFATKCFGNSSEKE